MPEAVETPVSPATNALIEGLDKWAGKNPKLAQQPPTTPEPPPTPTPEPAPEPKPEPKPPTQPEFKLPSFVTGEEPPKAPETTKEPEPALDELPKELPADASRQAQIDWKRARRKLDSQEAELRELRTKAAERESRGKQPDEATTHRIAELETRNKQYEEYFQRSSIENHPAFVQQVLRPMQTAYADAQRIISEAGGDTASLDRAIALSGKAHYDAMDEILSGLPESAKGELTATMRDYSRYAKQRQNALADAPRVAAEMKRQDAEREQLELQQGKEQMSQTYDAVVKHMRDQVGFELFRKTDDPELKWWNEMGDNIIQEGRRLYLENTDMTKVAQACVLAPAAITLKELWMRAEKRAGQAEKELAALRNSEPSMSSSGARSSGSSDKPLAQMKLSDAFVQVLKTKPWEK